MKRGLGNSPFKMLLGKSSSMSSTDGSLSVANINLQSMAKTSSLWSIWLTIALFSWAFISKVYFISSSKFAGPKNRSLLLSLIFLLFNLSFLCSYAASYSAALCWLWVSPRSFILALSRYNWSTHVLKTSKYKF